METNRAIPLAVIAIAVISLVIFYAVRGNTSQTDMVTQTTLSAEQQQAQSGSGASMDLPAQSTLTAPDADKPQDAEPVDSKTPATLVPDGVALDQFCKDYYDAWLSGDWSKAYAMIPYDDQKSMDVAAFQQRNEQYGLTDAKVGKPGINNNAASVVAAMNLSMGMTWYTTWTFVKNDKGQWVVKDTASAMAQQ